MEESPPPPPNLRAWTWVARIALVLVLLCVAAIGYLVWRYRSLFDEIQKAAQQASASLGPPKTFEEHFPKVDLVDGLLDEPETLPRLRGWSPELLASVPVGDGTFALLRGRGTEYALLGTDLAARGTLRTESPAFAIEKFTTPKEEVAGFALRSAKDTAAVPEWIAGIDRDGGTLWRWKPEDRGIRAAATLYDARGESGFVVGPGGEEGLVGLDLAGRPRWNVPRRHVVYELRTHPAVPGRFLLVSGGVTLFSANGTSAPNVIRTNEVGAGESERSKWTREWFPHAVLFAGAEGTAAFVLAGKSHVEDVPILVRMDERDERAWKANPNSEVKALALLEPPGKPRLVAAVTDAGDLLLLDETGTLRARARLPDAKPEERMAVYAFAAGRIGSDGWFVAVVLLHSTCVYRVHPERLR